MIRSVTSIFHAVPLGKVHHRDLERESYILEKGKWKY